MNYGKKQIRRQRQELTSKGNKLKYKVNTIVLIFLIVVLVGGLIYVGNYGVNYVENVLKKTPDISTIDATPSGYMSYVYDADGNVTAELVSSGANRVYVTLDEIPEHLQHAFVAIEDERFYEHNGIDVKGIIRAAIHGVTTGRFDEGASTITQQLLKNNVFEGWTSESEDERVERKLQEQFLAMQLEKKVDKDWIMENYLNTINLGQNTLGVEAASERYFGKDVSELTISESAVISAITQNPSKYNPISHPENNAERREKVLTNMKDQGYITEAEYNYALADDVYDRIKTFNVELESSDASVTSYFVDALTDQVVEDLQEILGYSEAEAYKALYSGGLSIYSTQDPEIQAICDEAANDKSLYDVGTKISVDYALTIQISDDEVKNYSEQTMLAYLRESNPATNLQFANEEKALECVEAYKAHLLEETGGTVLGERLVYTLQPQVAMTVMDQKTGQVKALVGGRGEKSASRTLNRASATTRQPGSTFKIITTYAPALDQDVVSLATGLIDEPITYATGKQVKNASGGYGGWTTIRNAIIHSVNVIAIKTSREVGLENCYRSALKFGISTLSEEDIVEALPLGGITKGVTDLEMTAAYAAIANKGVYNEPILYTKILDHDGNVLIDRKPESHRVIQEDTAFLLTSAMHDVVTSGTGAAANFAGMSIAGKTGTTTSARDAWFAAYTPYYTCVIWGGYDDNSKLESTRFTRQVWRAAMSKIHAGMTDPGFAMPDGLIRATVCATSGLQPIAGYCPETRTEYFRKGSIPTGYCHAHEYVNLEVCTLSGKLANPYCPADCREKRTYSVSTDGVVTYGTGPDMVKGDIPTETCDQHNEQTFAQENEKKAKREAAKAAALAAGGNVLEDGTVIMPDGTITNLDAFMNQPTPPPTPADPGVPAE